MKQPVKKVIVKKNTSADSFQGNLLWFVMSAIILAVGLYQAISLRWVSDDAFITYRYVQNFVAGHGIVYNVGEYVEGYTHFLWLLILSLTKVIGFDPVSASMWLGILCYAVILLLYVIISKKERQGKVSQSGKKFAIPLAAALLALNYDMNVWATGGLETALYTLFISLALYVWFYTALPERKKLLTLGGILLLGTLTRPDGALFTLAAIVLLAIKGLEEKNSYGEIIKRISFLVFPSVIIGLPYLFWKYHYYGNLLPATYYAKSAGENYFGQGFFYIFLFFKVYFSAAITVIVLALTALLKNRGAPRNNEGLPKTTLGSRLIAAMTAAAVYLVLNVARVGGDFMFARFMIPVLPLLYFIIERLNDRMPIMPKKYRFAIPLLLIATVIAEDLLREKILFHFDEKINQLAGNWDGPGGGETQGIADERWVYMRKRFLLNGVERGALDVYSDIGKYYEPFFEGIPVIVSITGAQNMIAYYANFQTVINEYGLTDTAIAHLSITKRGRIGHEKTAPEEYFIKRGVQLQFFAVVQELPKQRPWDMAAFEIPEYGIWQIAKVLTYDKPVIDELFDRFRASGVRTVLPKYDMIMPRYLKDAMPYLSVEQVKDDYEGFKKLFFNRYPDPQVQHQIEEYIASKSKG